MDEFVLLVPDFSGLSQPERVKHFAWFLETQQGKATWDQFSILRCYSAVAMKAPDVTREIGRLLGRGQVVGTLTTGYRLEYKVRKALDEKYGEHQSTVVVKQLLLDLPGKVSDDNERTFLREALDCYRVKAYRAAIVMTWNLAYAHFLSWLLADMQRLADFNARVDAKVGARRAGLRIKKRDNFEDLKEREVVEIAANADVISDNLKKVLVRGLEDRNLAAHPTGIEIAQPAADSAIHGLVTNVILKLV